MKMSWLIPFMVGASLVSQTAFAANALNKTEWTLQTLAGWQGQSLANIQHPATLAFNAAGVSGNDGCNSFSGRYTLSRHPPNGLRIPTDSMVSTMMACVGEGDTLARLYIQALGATVRYQLNGQQLSLLNAQGKVLATLKQPASELPNTKWQLMGYFDGRSGFVSSANTQKMTANFGANGSLTGSSGCNSYFASYTVNPAKNSLKIKGVGATEMFCAQPQDLMQEESHFLKALSSVKTYHRVGNSLEMFNAKGMRVLDFRLQN
ncbi:MAG: hypothetical protein RI964_2268 [Pseudomonadota bacterium]|jgi:heat shock protein HslJ